MIDFKHSPGPWEAVGSTVRTKITEERRGGFFVADCFRKWEEPVEFAFDGQEADGNARICAASLDMYAALKSAEEILQGLLGCCYAHGGGDKANFALGEIRGALAKVEGKA
jgi:hypothetical protein